MTMAPSSRSTETAAAVERIVLDGPWEATWVERDLDAATPDRLAAGPDGTTALDAPAESAVWLVGSAPLTAAAALAGHDQPPPANLDATDWWFRTRFEAPAAGPGEIARLRIGGIATIGRVFLNGTLIAQGSSMFAEHVVNVGHLLTGQNELLILCPALGPELARPRRPRARWRSRLVDDNAIRWFRTTLLGRAPGFAPGPPVIGPWRPIELERWTSVAVDVARLRARVDADGTGVLRVGVTLRSLGSDPLAHVRVHLDGPSGAHAADLAIDRSLEGEPTSEDGSGIIRAVGELRVAAVARWWPHTHGAPDLHAVRLEIATSGERRIAPLGKVGFRTVRPGPDGQVVERDGLDLRVNERRIFARGAVWTPGPGTVAGDATGLRSVLERARDAGFNMLRIPGFGPYESDVFHDLCDELGLLVWQDLAFANLDYPFGDPVFLATARSEVRAVVERLAARPSTIVVCGNSEVEQQVAMLGLPGDLGRPDFFRVEVPALLAEADSDAIHVPSAPTGGTLPFRTSVGIANYYGVGGYRRPLSDVRAARVRFAAECLAFSNVPDDAALDELAAIDAAATGRGGAGAADPGAVLGGQAWRAGVPRDNGSAWDFEDVRDHYLMELYGVDPAALRRSDPRRAIELGRLVTGEVMADVFGEWRRPGSGTGGGLVLWLRDLLPGPGWGVLDERGRPKVAWHHLRRALAPIAVWTTDEGLDGVQVHVANDPPAPLDARLRVALYQDDEVLVDEVAEDLRVEPGDAVSRDVEGMLGRFVDASWAYRFGPPVRTLIVASLEDRAASDAGATWPNLLAQAFRHPVGRPAGVDRIERIGLAGHVDLDADGRLALDADGSGRLTVRARRYAHGVRIRVPGFEPSDDSFGLEPGRARSIALKPDGSGRTFVGGAIGAVNAATTTPLGTEPGR